MINNQTVCLNGSDLTIEDIVAIGIGEKKVSLNSDSIERCRASRAFLESRVKAKHIIYGVNTSFGPMCNKIIDDNKLLELQVNLIRSHAAGLGDPIKYYIALGALAIRLNCLVKGYSGVRISLLEHMKDMINHGIAPYIPECGSVGASGDLVHLSHLALAVIGEGQVYYKKQLNDASTIFSSLGMRPVKLSYKEGLALINGTSVMTSIAAFTVFSTKKLLNIACVTSAFAVEIMRGMNDAFDQDLAHLKPHPGQIAISQIIQKLNKDSQNLRQRENIHRQIRNQASPGVVFETSMNVQDVYSIRCVPQILAPVMESLEYTRKTVECEANSSNDNPIIVPEKEKIIHGGNFHGQSIAYAMDVLSISVSEICNLSERRVNKLLDISLNEGLPEHLISENVGLTMGFMGAQYLATSSTAENRQLSNPVSIQSISCNASNQDVVSMGTIAARKAFKMVSNAKHVITVEVLADLQALSFRNSKTMGKALSKIYAILSGHFSVYDNKRIFYDDLKKFRKLLFTSPLFDDLSVYWT
jgi:histidine ammonia-lyase